MTCDNHLDCFNCPHPDCICDDFSDVDDAIGEYLPEDIQKREAYTALHREQKREYYLAHREELKAKSREYYHAHKEEISARRKAKYDDAKDAYNARRREKHNETYQRRKNAKYARLKEAREASEAPAAGQST